MDRRFAILADLHIGLRGAQSSGETFGDMASMTRRAVERLRVTEGIDEIVLLGDLVDLGLPDEYRELRDILSPIYSQIVPMCGNHELKRGRLADFERELGVVAARRTTLAGLPAVLLASGVEGLDDGCWRGEIGEAQLAMLDETIAGLGDEPLLLFVHHPFANTVSRSDRPMLSLDNSAAVLERLDRHIGPTVIFTGHNHAASIVRQGSRTFVGCGSIAYWPHVYAIVAVDERRMKYSTHSVCTEVEKSPDARVANAERRAVNEGGKADRAVTIEW